MHAIRMKCYVLADVGMCAYKVCLIVLHARKSVHTHARTQSTHSLKFVIHSYVLLVQNTYSPSTWEEQNRVSEVGVNFETPFSQCHDSRKMSEKKLAVI
jgi:hypothetical protein